MRLTAAAQAANKLLQINHSILIYGPPKSGKTYLTATASKVPSIKRIFWFDGENGFPTILNMGLSEEELAKFIVFKCFDTKETPYFIETMLKAFTSKVPVKICDSHGRVGCPECSKIPGAAFETFDIASLTSSDVVVIDSGSQLGTSASNASTMGKPDLYKLQFDDYGNIRKWLTDVLLVVQQAKQANFIVITQELTTEGEDGVERIYPLMGTKAFSAECSKFFGTVIHTHLKLGKHEAASSSTWKPNYVTGSRSNVKLEASVKPTMEELLK